MDLESRRTDEQKALDDANMDAYNRVLALTPIEVLTRLATLERRPFNVSGNSVYIQAASGDKFVPYNPLRNTQDAFHVMNKFIVLKDYEHYDCVGESFYAATFGRTSNPIRFWLHDKRWITGEFADFPIHTCICLAVLLNLDPDFTAHLK